MPLSTFAHRFKRLAGPARTAGEVLIIVFCLWHMLAVALVSLPSIAKGPGWQSVRSFLFPYTIYYLHTTSQWQTWSLFSPEPYNGGDGSAIEVLTADGWKEIYSLTREVPWWRHADEFRILRVMHNRDEQGIKLLERYLAAYCAGLGLPTGLPVRLRFQWSRPRYVTTIDQQRYSMREQSWPSKPTVCPAIDPLRPIAPVTLP